MTKSSPVGPAASPLLRYGFFGPVGTFTQEALHRWLTTHPTEAELPEPVAYASVVAALKAVRRDELDAAMVPIENSVEGGVSATLDALVDGEPLVVIGEVLVPITFVLAASPGVGLHELRAIGTHSHAWAQVREWMEIHLPDAQYVPTGSTASAAAALTAGFHGPTETATFQAAVCAPVAATAYGLTVLAEDIGDRSEAVTRFALVARAGRVLPEPTGADKSTLVLFQRSDHAGALLELLEQFSVRGINITRLESRPTKQSMGSYCFSIDIEGHVADERVGEALLGLKRVAARVVFLGSYPAVAGAPVHVPANITNAAFVQARQWVESLRG